RRKNGGHRHEDAGRQHRGAARRRAVPGEIRAMRRGAPAGRHRDATAGHARPARKPAVDPPSDGPARRPPARDGERAMSDKRYTALVLAATRGNLDPLAAKGGVSHKVFIDLHGVPMLRRVVAAVAESGRVGRILIAIEDEAVEE